MLIPVHKIWSSEIEYTLCEKLRHCEKPSPRKAAIVKIIPTAEKIYPRQADATKGPPKIFGAQFSSGKYTTCAVYYLAI